MIIAFATGVDVTLIGYRGANEALGKALQTEFVRKRFADLSSTVPGAEGATPAP